LPKRTILPAPPPIGIDHFWPLGALGQRTLGAGIPRPCGLDGVQGQGKHRGDSSGELYLETSCEAFNMPRNILISF
jgi:hypothetical protein